MTTYRRRIKFCYYKVIKFEKNEGQELTKKGKYNLAEWLMLMEKQKHHNIELSDCLANLDKVENIKGTDFYVMRLYKLRDANVPSKVKEGEGAFPIPLEKNEYIGEDLILLYDRFNSACMVQQNRHSLGIGRLEEWINLTRKQSNERIKFLPIADKFTKEELRKKTIRSIEFSFANLQPEASTGGLADIIHSFGKFTGVMGKISISVGRSKSAELNKDSSLELIEDLWSNPGLINSAKVKYKSDIMRDDDKSRIEVIDLFENVLHDYIIFEIEAKKSLDFQYAKLKLLEKYKEQAVKIKELCDDK